jgi:cholesterol transport system auxiliary component
MMRKDNRSIRAMLALTAASLLLASCVSLGAKAPPSMLVLTPASGVVAGTVLKGNPKDALVILLAEVPRKLDTNRVPVQVDESNVAYIKDAIWADKPARLMQQLLMEVIAAKNGTLVLNEVDAGGKAQQFLSGSLIEFGIDAASMEAVVAYDAVRLEKGMVVEKRRFEARQTISKVEPGPSGAALNDAANKVANDIAAWLATQ